MLKHILLAIALLGSSVTAHAHGFKTLECRAANGVQISAEGSDTESSMAETSLMGFRRSFLITYMQIGLVTRLGLSNPSQPNEFAYDIYLNGAAPLVGSGTFSGIMGQTLYGVGLDRPFVAPIWLPAIVPAGFRPIAAITCDIVR